MDESSPATRPPEPSGPSATVGVLAPAILSVVALVFAGVAVFVADGGGEDEAVSSSGVVVTLTEFAISPDPIVIAPGTDLEVVNGGSALHNLALADVERVKTADLGGGASDTFPSGDLDPGTYELICTIPGHEAAGMTATLEVTEDVDAVAAAMEAAATDGHSASTPEQWAALDAAMTESMLEFPAETEGVGNQKLEFEIAPDGAKVFELTAEIAEWEVEPGTFVEAWTYNGMVPGPWIDVEVGDLVRVEVQNDLPMGTDIHWHGVRTPNDQDGVAPYTQPLIEAGESFTYEFVARDVSVGMYHAHHHAQMQVVNGMFAPFTIGDVALPRGQTISGRQIPADLVVAEEIPMVLNDAGVIGLSLNGKSFPATAPHTATVGDWKLIHYYNEGLSSHPMHLHQFPQLVVAKDGIPLDNPFWADTINVAAGERYSVLVNFTDPGTWAWHCHILTHVENDDGMFGMVTAFVVE